MRPRTLDEPSAAMAPDPIATPAPVLARLVVLACVGIAVVTQTAQFLAPDFGYDEPLPPAARIVERVDADGPAAEAGLRVGDRIVSDPGKDLLQWAGTERELHEWVARHRAAIAQRNYVVVVEREGVERAITLPPPSTRPTSVLRRLRVSGGLLLPLCSHLLMAWLLVRAAVPSRSRILVGLGLALLGLGFGLNVFAVGWPAWLLHTSNVLLNASVPAGIGTLAFWAWTAPTTPAPARVHALRYGMATTGALAGGSSMLDCWHLIRSPLPGNTAAIAWDTLALLTMIAGLIWQRTRAANAVERRAIDVILGGLGVLVVAAVAANLQEGHFRPLLFIVVFTMVGALPIAFAISTGRYRLFALDAVVPSAALHAFVLVASLGAYLFTIGIAALALPRLGIATTDTPWFGLVAVLAIGSPLRTWAERHFETLFSADRRRFFARLSAMLTGLADAGSEQEIAACIARQLDVPTSRFLTARESASVVAQLLEGDGLCMVLEIAERPWAASLVASGVEVVVAVNGEDRPPRALGFTSPLRATLLGRNERRALRSVGKAVAARLGDVEERTHLTRAVASGEQARRHFAMELHDGIGATLTSAQLLAKRASARGADDDVLEELQRTLADGITDLRLALRSLDEYVSFDEVLARVRRHVGDVCGSSGIAAQIDVSPVGLERVGSALRLTVVRVVQEAVTNVVRHANASRLRCSVDRRGEYVCVVVEDDGIGVGSTNGDGGDGRGLRNMRRRVMDLGGAFRVERGEGGGTRVIAEIPVDENEHAAAP